MAEGLKQEASGLKEDLEDALAAGQERREETAQKEQQITQVGLNFCREKKTHDPRQKNI